MRIRPLVSTAIDALYGGRWRTKNRRKSLARFWLPELQLAEASGGADGDCGILMLRKVGDEHHGNSSSIRISLQSADYFNAVGIIYVELTIHEDEVEPTRLQFRERSCHVVGLYDLAIEIAGQIRAD